MSNTRNTMRLDMSGFEGILKKLERLGGDMKDATSSALKKAGKKVEVDTHAAIASEHLPAHGKYSTGATDESIIKDPAAEWQGDVGSIPVGFDFNKPGAGGYLISGTPRMTPDPELRRMYRNKKYMLEIHNLIGDEIGRFVIEEMSK